MISILPSEEPSNKATVSRARAASRWMARSGSSGPYHAGLSQPPYSRICAPSARCCGLERQAPHRIDERAPPSACDDAHRDWRERRAIGGRSRLVDRAAGQRRHRGDGVDIGGLALIGRHAERRVALEMLDRDVALARGERDVLQRDVVLEIDPAPTFVVGLGPSGLDSVVARRRVRRSAFAAAGRVALAQSVGEREGAVGGAGDGQVFDAAQGHERGSRLVIAQAPRACA